MKIILLTATLLRGGAERQLVTLARGLHERGHSVKVATFYAGGSFEDELRASGVPLQVLDKGGRWDVARFVPNLIRFLRRERPEILHGYLGTPNLFGLLAKPFSGGKVVWGVRASDMREDPRDPLPRALALIQPFFARFPDLIVCNSHAGHDHVVSKGFPSDRTIVIPNGIDTDRFQRDPAARRQVRAQWNVADCERLVGLVGRLDPMKDHPTFLRTAATLASRHKDLKFVCVGDGPGDYGRGLRNMAGRLGLADRLLWVGARLDMPAVYNALDVVVLSSAYGEGFPNVVGEAMACGVPCVVTDVGDSALIVGPWGEVAPPGDPQALGEAVTRALDRMARGEFDFEAIRARISDHFSLSSLIENTERTLLGLLTPQGA